MTATDPVTQLRALADHIEKHRLGDTLLQMRGFGQLQINGGREAVRNILRWADTLGDVAMFTTSSGQYIHIVATGTLASGHKLEVVAVADGESAAFLAAHLPVPNFVPVERSVVDVETLRRLSDTTATEAGA